MNKRNSEIIGLFVSSAVPPLIFAIIGLAFNTQNQLASFSEALLYLVVSLVGLYPYSILFAALLGIPIFLIARRLEIVTWWFSLLTGMLVGFLAAIFMRSGKLPDAKDLLQFMPAGAIAAIVFWLIWRRGR